jgi:hypothetical protein
MNQPMEKVDQALESLRIIRKDFDLFFANNNYITEADTRVNLIDRILKEVLYWPPHLVSREQHTDSGYMDYVLSTNGKKFVCVEAKKEGRTFLLPKDKDRKYYVIKGTLATDESTIEAINQARQYCDDTGIRYAVVTNGYTWIIFRAIREDMPWRQGSARVFESVDNILEHFTEFWNLLSFDCISNGLLDSEFSSTTTSNRELNRVLNFLWQPDMPLLRNSLHTELHPVIASFFEDIADPNHIETLENCYVYTNSIKTVANDINFVIQDAIPKFLVREGTIDIKTGPGHAGFFGNDIEKSFAKTNGQLFLLLGGIGAGKSTFQKRYQLTVGKKVLEESTLWFSIDFLKPPQEHELENFVWQGLLRQLREKYDAPRLETRKNIKRIFRLEIEALHQTALYGLSPESQQYEEKLNQFLGKWQQDLAEYVPRLLALAKPKKHLTTVIFFDNVDQLTPSFQAQIFLLAQRVTDKVKSTTIIALREESYYTAAIQKVFTAYINRKFHIASPNFRKMIGQRIRYARKVIESNSENNEINIYKEFKELQNKNNISDFLKIVEHSIFEKNKNISRFIDHLCFGNMRYALQMFSTFLVSGATDVDKMLRIYRREGNYFVAYHEFIRSIMLGERFYYKESSSVILNVFECGQEKNSSHFTSLRILTVLNLHRSASSKEGEGFYEIVNLLSIFEDAFNNKEDFLKSLSRLVSKHLVETNTKISESLNTSTHVRITSAGWYYIKYLVHSFAYLDLVFQDTPINDQRTVEQLVDSLHKVNNLSDPEEDKVSRMDERFRRISLFLDYLKREEDAEVVRFFPKASSAPIYTRFVPFIKNEFDERKNWIQKRVKDNREKYQEDSYSGEEQLFGLQIDQEESE